MTGRDDFDRTLASWFEAEAISPAPAGDLDRILDATRRRRPRPAWLAGPGSHWVGTARTGGRTFGVLELPRLGVRWSTALILLLAVIALVGGAILIGARLTPPSPIPTGRLGQLAYSLDGDIYLADWDGRNPVRIADGAPAAGPAACGSFFGALWSPDDGHLMYRSAAEGCPDTIFISDPAGVVVASFPGPGIGWNVSWSPDSSRISMWVEPGRTIGIYGLDGVRQALVSVPAGLSQGGEFNPKWSPDGRSLLLNLGGCQPGVGCIEPEPWELPVDGGPARPVPADDPRRSPRAVYSRDGTRVAFLGIPDSYSLVIAEADGTELRVLPGARNEWPLAGENHDDPLWSPSGDRVAFTRSVFDGTGRTDDYGALESAFELRLLEVASGKVTTLVAGRDIHAIAGRDINAVAFSPDGDRLLFSRADVGGLWTVKADGSDAQLLIAGTDDGGWQGRPAPP